MGRKFESYLGSLNSEIMEIVSFFLLRKEKPVKTIYTTIDMKILIWILIFGIHGCQNGSKQQNELISTKWRLLGMHHDVTGIFESLPSDLSGMNIVFNNSNRLIAASSCNTAYGHYSLTGKNSLKIDSVSITKMFCADSIQIVWEDKYITGLKYSDTYEISADTLTIKTSLNRELKFKAESKSK